MIQNLQTEKDLLAGLNPQQREAVHATDGALLILAGAGSGKTRVITVRIAYLIAEKQVAPHNILAVTFTNKAASEMRDRVDNLLKGRNLHSAPLISTFHSLCVRILRQDIEALQEGYTKSFTIYDTDDSIKVIKQCVKDIGLDEKQLAARQVQNAISSSKNRGEDFEDYASRVEYTDERKAAIARVFKMYEERLNNSNALDFDDLLIKTVRLLRVANEVREKYNNKFKYILVDEYQDTNALQFALIKYLTEKQKNICVVGDDAQCLPRGTNVLTPNGLKKIEDLSVADEVLTAGGHSRVLISKIERVKRNRYSGKLVEIETEKGKFLKATPNHILYGKLNILPEKHFVYLMYRQDKGYRIGRSMASRNAGSRRDIFGLQVRCNQEVADKMWILKVCETKAESAYFENLFSIRYGIPTMVFHLRGRDTMSWTQEMLDKLYTEIDTRNNERKIFEDFSLFPNYPHFRPKSRFEANRFVLNLVKFGDRRASQNAPWGAHRLQFGTTERSIRPEFEAIGLPCREGRRRTWRMETARTGFDNAFETANRILEVDSRIELQSKAALVKGAKSFFEFPAGNFLKGMSIAVFQDGEIIEDIVKDVKISEYTGEVFDLDIADTHNFISQEIVTHNSIYGFRGADIENILSFENAFPNAKVIMLEQNYRSTQTILDAADAIISNNSGRKEKKLWTDNPSGERVFYFQAFDGDNEARFVAQKIDEHRRRNPKDKLAILYRTNAQSRVFEEALRRARIEYNIVGGFSFYERAEIKDIIAYLKLSLNPFDDIALNRVINTPARGLGKTSLDELAFRAKDYGVSLWETLAIITDHKDDEKPKGFTPRALESLKNFKKVVEKLQTKVSEFAASDRAVSEVVIAAIEDTGYANMLRAENSDESNARIENLDELVNAAVDYDKQEADGMRDFIDHAALVSDTDKFDRNAAVTMMTVHSAKGLEFPIVFLVGLEDGIFPHSRSINDPKELEEERRLAYVAITRAEKVLYISHSMRRRVYGEEMAAEPSQFLNELPIELIEDISRGQSWLSYKKSSAVKSSQQTAKILRGQEQQFEKPKNTYAGKTYNSSDAIAEFFKNRGQQTGGNDSAHHTDLPASGTYQQPTISRPSAFENLKSASTPQDTKKSSSPNQKSAGGFVPGSHVRHAKYGKGLVLRREGTGDQVKLTISFPGFGQKKLIEKFANLENA